MPATKSALPPVDPSQWTIIPNYGPESQHYHCSTCGMPHRTGTNEPVLRGNWIEMEGYYDICVDCARHAGRLVGLVDPSTVEGTNALNRKLGDEVVELKAQVQALNTLVEGLRAYNAGADNVLAAQIDDLTDQLGEAHVRIAQLEEEAQAAAEEITAAQARLGDPEE